MIFSSNIRNIKFLYSEYIMRIHYSVPALYHNSAFSNQISPQIVYERLFGPDECPDEKCFSLFDDNGKIYFKVNGKRNDAFEAKYLFQLVFKNSAYETDGVLKWFPSNTINSYYPYRMTLLFTSLQSGNNFTTYIYSDDAPPETIEITFSEIFEYYQPQTNFLSNTVFPIADPRYYAFDYKNTIDCIQKFAKKTTGNIAMQTDIINDFDNFITVIVKELRKLYMSPEPATSSDKVRENIDILKGFYGEYCKQHACDFYLGDITNRTLKKTILLFDKISNVLRDTTVFDTDVDTDVDTNVKQLYDEIKAKTVGDFFADIILSQTNTYTVLHTKPNISNNASDALRNIRSYYQTIRMYDFLLQDSVVEMISAILLFLVNHINRLGADYTDMLYGNNILLSIRNENPLISGQLPDAFPDFSQIIGHILDALPFLDIQGYYADNINGMGKSDTFEKTSMRNRYVGNYDAMQQEWIQKIILFVVKLSRQYSRDIFRHNLINRFYKYTGMLEQINIDTPIKFTLQRDAKNDPIKQYVFTDGIVWDIE